MTDKEKSIKKIRSKRMVIPELTKHNREVISLALERLPENERKNTTEVTYAVSEVLAEQYGTKDEDGNYYLTDRSLYQLARAGMETTLDIKEKVELYLARF